MNENNITAWSNECPLYQLFDLFGKKWTLHIFQSLNIGISTYSGLMRRLPQINSKVLTERLDLLVEKGYVVREVSQSKPLKINYYLTEEGKELYHHLDNLTNRVLSGK